MQGVGEVTTHTHTHTCMGTYHQPLILIGVEKREKDQTSAGTRGLERDREREIAYTRHRKEATIETQTKGSKGRVD